MPRIIALDHIVLNVADVERSLAFYEGVLGLPAERVEAWRRGELRFPSVRVNEATIVDLVHAPAEAGQRQLNLAHFCLVTDAEDLDAVARDLTAQGVKIEVGRAGERPLDLLPRPRRQPDRASDVCRKLTTSSGRARIPIHWTRRTGRPIRRRCRTSGAMPWRAARWRSTARR